MSRRRPPPTATPRPMRSRKARPTARPPASLYRRVLPQDPTPRMSSPARLTVSSVEPNGPPPTYVLTDDAGGRFAINSSTGVVTVANGAAIDYETAPGHAYSVTAQATAGAQTNTQTFAIGVADVAPSAPTDSTPAANTA